MNFRPFYAIIPPMLLTHRQGLCHVPDKAVETVPPPAAAQARGVDCQRPAFQEGGMTTSKPEPIRDRAALLQLFRRVERHLWVANIEPGLPRFFELATLLFLKLLAERQQDLSWETLKFARDKIHHLNGSLIPSLRAKYNATDIFTPTQITQEHTLKSIVALLGRAQFTSLDSDILGDAYEYFLKHDIDSKQSLGQFFTPRPLAKALVALVSPIADDTVYDPFCGAGGLLLEACNHVKNHGSINGSLFFGRETASSARVAKMNAILHWGSPSGIEQIGNTLAHPLHGQYSVGLANVPFARDPRNDPYNALYQNGLAGKKTDVLSVLHLFQAIKKGERMAAIVPEGFLCGTERQAARRFLADNANLRLVASLPHDMFRPYTHVKAAIIYLDNLHCPAPQESFWYLDIQNGDALNTLAAFHQTPEEKLLSLGYVRVDREAVHRNGENWIGKHYANSTIKSPYPLVPLSQLVSFVVTGFSYKVGQLSDNDNGIPLFTLKSINKGFSPKCETRYLKYETHIDEKSACLKGDMLIALKDTNREAALLGQAAIADRKGVFSADLVKIEVKAKTALSGEYLRHCLKGEAYLNEIKKFTVGSITKSIALKDIASIKIPLPPLLVQKELVNELNRYETLIASQNEAANFLHEQRQERIDGLWG